MTTPLIPPALSAKEWGSPESEVDVACGVVWAGLGGVTTGDLEAIGERPPHLNITWRTVSDELAISRRHALAALALHGLPEGFTREDVEELRWTAIHEESADYPIDGRVERLRSLAARIEALLPPLDAPTPHP